MWFIFNITMLIIFCFLRAFCVITTFKALKYSEDFYEWNPILKKALKWKYGKILLWFLAFIFLFIFIIVNLIWQVIYPEYIWLFTIFVFIISPVLTYDFVNNLIVFLRYYREAVRND